MNSHVFMQIQTHEMKLHLIISDNFLLNEAVLAIFIVFLECENKENKIIYLLILFWLRKIKNREKRRSGNDQDSYVRLEVKP